MNCLITRIRFSEKILYDRQIFTTSEMKASLFYMCRFVSRWPTSSQTLLTPTTKRMIPFRNFKKRSDDFLKFTPDSSAPECRTIENRGRFLLKAAGFTAICCGCFYTGAAIAQYERVRSYARSNNFFRIRSHAGKWRRDLNHWWYSLSDGDRVFWPICLLNGAVFLAWRVPAWQTFMTRWFMCNPAGKSPYLPMLLSSFSHYSAAHFFVNMYVLNSFVGECCRQLGPEQFVGLYLSGAMTSSLASHAVKVIRCTQGVSLGASGSIMCVLGYACTQMPDLRLAIVFLPSYTFAASDALKAILAFDGLGVLLNWQFLDHAAHLGGAFLGILWAKYGPDIWKQRNVVLDVWHKIRD